MAHVVPFLWFIPSKYIQNPTALYHPHSILRSQHGSHLLCPHQCHSFLTGIPASTFALISRPAPLPRNSHSQQSSQSDAFKILVTGCYPAPWFPNWGEKLASLSNMAPTTSLTSSTALLLLTLPQSRARQACTPGL